MARKWTVGQGESSGGWWVFEENPKKRRFNKEMRYFKTQPEAEAYAEVRRKQDADRAAVVAGRRSKRMAARAAIVNRWKPGDLLVNSWGYDQTNIDYWQVVATTAKTVTIRRIGSKTIPGSEGFMQSDVLPAKDSFLDPERYPAETKHLQIHVGYDGKVGETYIPAEFGCFADCYEWEKHHETHYA